MQHWKCNTINTVNISREAQLVKAPHPIITKTSICNINKENSPCRTFWLKIKLDHGTLWKVIWPDTSKLSLCEHVISWLVTDFSQWPVFSSVYVNVVREQNSVLSTDERDSLLCGVKFNICTRVPQILSFWISILSTGFPSSRLMRVWFPPEPTGDCS